ncbi:MAG TPA: metal-sensitive transcriptional regulator [Oscillatoriaceae cyanobacterium]
MSDQKILNHLRRIEGQIKGLQRMISEKRDCDEILTQVMAAKAALDRVTSDLVEAHLDECLSTAPPDQLRQKLLKTLKTLAKM